MASVPAVSYFFRFVRCRLVGFIAALVGLFFTLQKQRNISCFTAIFIRIDSCNQLPVFSAKLIQSVVQLAISTFPPVIQPVALILIAIYSYILYSVG